jgi:exodeoxyribonuclease III
VQSRYLEAKVGRLRAGCLYRPNGNPAPGPKFDDKLASSKRLAAHAAKLVKMRTAVVLAGDYNAVPTELDAYNPKSWADDALFLPEIREAYRGLGGVRTCPVLRPGFLPWGGIGDATGDPPRPAPHPEERHVQ